MSLMNDEEGEEDSRGMVGYFGKNDETEDEYRDGGMDDDDDEDEYQEDDEDDDENYSDYEGSSSKISKRKRTSSAVSKGKRKRATSRGSSATSTTVSGNVDMGGERGSVPSKGALNRKKYLCDWRDCGKSFTTR
jgi:FtsZ-interacting cell division protein YlmF